MVNTTNNQPATQLPETMSLEALNTSPDTLERHLNAGLETMVKFAAKRSLPIPIELNLEHQSKDTLLTDFNKMAQTIQPATVQSINYINEHILCLDDEKPWYKTPIFAKCLIIAALALICLISVGLLDVVNQENQEQSILTLSGLDLFYNLLFICSASLLGVMFYLLKTISDKIKDYTLLPVDAIEINSTIIIGLISGFVVAELFTINFDSLPNSIEMQKMTLALLGGFSSDAIFSTLQAVVDKVKALFAAG
ncbi:MAG: hypothetical protein AAGJ18_04315 [Bacteroidota bacterium]